MKTNSPEENLAQTQITEAPYKILFGVKTNGPKVNIVSNSDNGSPIYNYFRGENLAI